MSPLSMVVIPSVFVTIGVASSVVP